MMKHAPRVIALAVPIAAMQILPILVVLFFSVIATPVAAAEGHAFCQGGVPDNLELARRTERSLKVDPSGDRPLERCRATPNDFLKAWRENDPGANLERLDQLVAFIREDLVLAEAKKGVEYWSACLQDTPTGHNVITNCSTRHIGENGEKVYKRRGTDKIDLQSNCANPTGNELYSVQVKVDRPKPPVNCYEVPIDNTGQSDVTTDASGASYVVVRFNASDEVYARMLKNRCFGVVSESHPAWNMERLQESCGDGCRGGQYPSAPLATAAGLAPTRPNRTLWFMCEGKKCIHSFAKEDVVEVTDLTYCVDVDHYHVQIEGFKRWTAVDRFNVVYPDQIARTVKSGKLDRTLHGENHFLPIEPGQRAQ